MGAVNPPNLPSLCVRQCMNRPWIRFGCSEVCMQLVLKVRTGNCLRFLFHLVK